MPRSSSVWSGILNVWRVQRAQYGARDLISGCGFRSKNFRALRAQSCPFFSKFLATPLGVAQFVSQRVPPFFQVTQECQSEHINIWHTSLVSCSGLILVLLAVLIRKLKWRDYKDSEKLLLVAVTLAVVRFGVPRWIIFQSNADTLMR